MADVSSGYDAEVTSDCSGIGGQGVGGAEDLSTSGDDSNTFPDHTDDGA